MNKFQKIIDGLLKLDTEEGKEGAFWLMNLTDKAADEMGEEFGFLGPVLQNPDDLYSAFIWDDTPQGLDFWYYLCMRLRENGYNE